MSKCKLTYKGREVSEELANSITDIHYGIKDALLEQDVINKDYTIKKGIPEKKIITNSELTAKVEGFLKSLNVEVNTLNDLKEITGYDIEAATDLLYKTILLKNTENIEDNLLKETAYVAYSFLGKKNKIRTDLISSITELDNFESIYNSYKEKSPNLNDYKIKELIVIDLLADAIKNNYNNPKDSYINKQPEYWQIKGNSKLEKQLKYYLSKIQQFIKNLLGNNKLSKEEVNNILDDIANDILNSNFNKFGTVLSSDQQLTNYEKTIATDKKAEKIVKDFQEMGLILTGSLSLRKQGTLYRTVDEDLHDLDFSITLAEQGDYFNTLYKEYLKLAEGASEIGKTFILEKFQKELSINYKKHPILNKIKSKYPNFEVTNSFSGIKGNDVTISGTIGDYMIDLFFVSDLKLDSNDKGFQDWQPIFEAKIKMGRAKDIRDFANYVPFNVNKEKLTKTSGFRHYNFSNIENNLKQKEQKVSDKKTRDAIKEINRIHDSKVAVVKDGKVEIDVYDVAYSSYRNQLNKKTVSRKVYNLDVDEETLLGYEKKAQLMENVFSKNGLASHIIFDGDLKDSGQNIGTEDARYKEYVSKGFINEGDILIAVNPTKLYSDTVFHEYAHTFIDVVGGLDNTRIRYAASKLKTSPLYLEVASQYPELSASDLDKEVLATAMGKKADEIFSNPNDISFIQRFFNWLKDQIKGIFGIKEDVITELSKQLLGDTSFDVVAEQSTVTQRQKDKDAIKFASDVEKKIQGSIDVIKAISTRLSNAYQSVAKSTDENKVKYREKIKEYKDEVDKLASEDNVKAIAQFLSYSKDYVNNMDSKLKKMVNAIRNDESIDIKASLLQQIEENNAVFNVIKDVIDIMRDSAFKKDFEKSSFSDIDYADFIRVAEEIKAKQDTIAENRIIVGIKHIAKKLAPYSNRLVIEERMKLAVEKKKLYPRKQNESNSQYNSRINEMVSKDIAELLPELKVKEEVRIEKLLKNAPYDISNFAAWVSSEKDLNSMVIQLASKLLDEADLKVSRNILNYKLQAHVIFEEFKKETSGLTGEAKYKGLYHKGSNGKLYITGKYNPEWFIKHTALFEETNRLFEEQGHSAEYIKAKANRDKWIKENSIGEGPNMIPSDKWLDENYKQIMSNPNSGKAKMLQFLINSSIENSKRLNGNLSLVKSLGETDINFILAPNIGKNFFEKITDAKNIKSNTVDWFTSIFKAKADTTEFGQQAVDDKSEVETLSALTNIKGEVKGGVPIHFRRSMSLEDISYDLMSSILTDTYMAENYAQKIGLQTELELLKDIVAERDVDQRFGTFQKILTTGLDKTGKQKVAPKKGIDSNEFKVLNSLIENRLYGIKTKPSEFAIVATTLMKWSSSTMLMLNLPANLVNAVQGQVFNFVESVGGQYFNKTDLAVAQRMWWKDIGANLNDIGKPVNLSMSNQLMDLLNIQGSMSALSNKFIEDNRFKALANTNSAFALSHIGEHYMHGTLMYAIFNNIKILNKKGQFIDKDGKVVDSKDKAMSLTEAISLNDKNELTLNPHAYKTTHGNQKLSLDSKGMVEIKQLVNKIAHDLHGNYNSEIQSMAQRYIWLKLIFMLRKWIVSGFNKRWRGTAVTSKKLYDNFKTGKLDSITDREIQEIFYSEDLQSFQEGYYTTALRFFGNYLNTVKADLSKLSIHLVKSQYEGMTELEQQNVRRFLADVTVMISMAILATALYGLADDLPEDSLSRDILFYNIYTARRLYMESAAYFDPSEALRIAASPAASTAYIVKLTKLIGQIQEDSLRVLQGEGLERYERTRRKGETKLWKVTNDVLPMASAIYGANIEEKYSWLANLN